MEVVLIGTALDLKADSAALTAALDRSESMAWDAELHRQGSPHNWPPADWPASSSV
jgi:hypothetical protein